MDSQIPIPPDAYVEGALNTPFLKQPSLSQILRDADHNNRDLFLQSLYHNAKRFPPLEGHTTSSKPQPQALINVMQPTLPNLVNGIAKDSGDSGKDRLTDWFTKMSTAAKRTPLYAIKKDTSVVQEAKAKEENLPANEEADVDALAKAIAKKKKKKVNHIFKRSPAYNSIILTNSQLIVPYASNTINALGNHSGAPFSTTISFSSHEFLPSHLHLNFNLYYGDTNIQIASVKIPLRNITNEPSTKAYSLKQITAYLDSLNIKHEVGSGAYIVQITRNSSKILVSFREQAFRELNTLGMPYLNGLRQQITRPFDKSKFGLTIIVPDGWEEFKPWIKRLSTLRKHALGDTLKLLKKTSKSQPINHKNYKHLLPKNIPFAPALNVFNDVEQFMTIHSNAIARKHKYQE